MKLIKKLSKNREGIDYIVGDIHGAFTKLGMALRAINFDDGVDRLISVGDLVDRGVESPLYHHWLDKPWFHAVRGNHEDMAIKFAEGHWPLDNYIANGGEWNANNAISERNRIADDLLELPFIIEIETSKGTVGVIHANTRGNSWKYMLENIMLSHVQEHYIWSRDRIWNVGAALEGSNSQYVGYEGNYVEYEGDDVKYVRAVVVGHTPSRKVVKIGNVYHIDTMGWTPTGKFTFLNAETLEFIQA